MVLAKLAPEPADRVAAAIPLVSPMRMMLLLQEPPLLICKVPALMNVSPAYVLAAAKVTVLFWLMATELAPLLPLLEITSLNVRDFLLSP